MSTIASKVTLINRDSSFDSRKLTKEFVESKGIKIIMGVSPIEITGDTYNVEKLILRDNESGDITNLKADFIFVEIGYSPATTFLSSKILSETKIVSVNPTTRETNIPGLYAAGDVSKDVDRQIVTATSDGAIAAMNAIKYVKEDFEQARKNATNV
jgi:thioredoxin reductase (NADPH)